MNPEHAIGHAVTAIDTFLLMSAHSPEGCLTAEVIRELSFRIERAQYARLTASPLSRDRLVAERYRDSLVRLRQRLGEIEALLGMERDRISQEQARLAGVREWHSQFTRTQ